MSQIGDNDSVVVVRKAKDNENLVDFTGDGIVVPCDVDLTNSSANEIVREVTARAGEGLQRELAATGFCEIGHAIITKGYDLSVRHIIFLPVADRNDPQAAINYLTLHQALRNALTLATIYSLETIAVPAIKLKHKKAKTLFKRLIWMLAGNGDESGPDESQKEFTDILTSVSSEFDSTSIREIIVCPDS